MRVQAGIEWTRVELDGGLDIKSGRGLTWDAAAGVTLTPNLVLFGDLLYAEIPGINAPTVRGIGIGAAYYINAINLAAANAFVSATIAATRIWAVPDGAQNPSSADGPGARVAVGAEWRLARHFGLGLAGGVVVVRANTYSPGWVGTGYFLVSSLSFS